MRIDHPSKLIRHDLAHGQHAREGIAAEELIKPAPALRQLRQLDDLQRPFFCHPRCSFSGPPLPPRFPVRAHSDLPLAISMACGGTPSVKTEGTLFAASERSTSIARSGPTEPISLSASATFAASSGASASSVACSGLVCVGGAPEHP
jgi:hypothetical protein